MQKEVASQGPAARERLRIVRAAPGGQGPRCEAALPPQSAKTKRREHNEAGFNTCRQAGASSEPGCNDRPSTRTAVGRAQQGAVCRHGRRGEGLA